MVAAPINPAQILDTYRKSDAVIIVCQNNERKMIEIAAINDEASSITGYTNKDLLNKPLVSILPERISSTIDEFVEYSKDANDLLAVLNKIRNFSVKTRDGRTLEFTLRIIRGEPINDNPWFHLILIDEEKVRKTNAFKALLKENFKGHEVIDRRTTLPDPASIAKDLELVVHSVRSNDIAASFAVIEINHYNTLKDVLGKNACGILQQHIGHICRHKLRVEDTIGTLSDNMMGVILVDASQEAARMVLNRLRWVINVSPLKAGKEELFVQVNIGFAQVDGKLGEADIIGKCSEFVKQLSDKETNSIHLVVTHERRVGSRRSENQSVADNRRKKDRRRNNDDE